MHGCQIKLTYSGGEGIKVLKRIVKQDLQYKSNELKYHRTCKNSCGPQGS